MFPRLQNCQGINSMSIKFKQDVSTQVGYRTLHCSDFLVVAYNNPAMDWRLFITVLVTVSANVKDGENLSIDEELLRAVESATAIDFIQSNDTLLIELDMIISREEWEQTRDKKKRGKRSSSRAHLGRNWPDATVLYRSIGDDVYTPKEKQALQAAIDDYHRYTCIKWRPYGNHNNLLFIKGGACFADIGYQFKQQVVSLTRACLAHHGMIVHELGHAVGLRHEQTRHDRDDYVRVDKNNIDTGNYYNFKKYESDELYTWDIPYDYLSIMHYGEKAFANDLSRPSIYTLDERYQFRIGQRHGLSFEDIQLLNYKYNCNSHCGNKRCPKGGFLSKDCTCWCKRSVEFGEPVAMCDTGERVPGGPRGGSIGECGDSANNCNWYTERNFCENEYGKKSLVEKCRKSCGWCDKGDVIINGRVIEGPTRPQGERKEEDKKPEKPKNFCHNADRSCILSTPRYCTNHPGYWDDKMATDCKRSCGYCGSGILTGQECQYQTLDIGCRPGQVLKIHDAMFGRQDTKTCMEGPIDTDSCKSTDALAKVKQACEGQTWCKVVADGFQDPCPRTYKYLNVDYECVRKGAQRRRGRAKFVCEDKLPNCEDMRRKDDCRRNPAFMNSNCRKTCRACRRPFSAAAEKCEDANPHCEAWAPSLCEEAEVYMKQNCPKACGFCRKPDKK